MLFVCYRNWKLIENGFHINIAVYGTSNINESHNVKGEVSHTDIDELTTGSAMIIASLT